MGKTLLSIGHGFSARALAPLLINDGWRVIGTTRSPDKAQSLIDQGVEPVIWPDADLTPYIKEASHILSSVAPNDDGDPFLNQYSEALKQHKSGLEWVGYLSTTGVYGDHQGGWVDETSALTPSTKRGKLRVQAEALWAELGLPLHVFRLAGIYGPGRGPFAKVRNGTARRIVKKDQVFSRIHVDDIATVLAASIEKPRIGAIYNLCDNDAAPPEDVIEYAAMLLKMDVPVAVDYADADMTPMARSFYAESKRVRNELIKTELGVELKYPNYRAGLKKLLEQQT